MLVASLELKNHLLLIKSERNQAVTDSLVSCILQLGTLEDAYFLLNPYLENYSDYDYNDLLILFKKFGDQELAEKICQTVIVKNRLSEEANPSVLEVLGYLKYEPVKNLLFQYGFSKIDTDYYLQTYSLLGLLHFDCSEFQNDIEKAIDECLFNNLFTEYIPALVCKLPERSTYLEKLYELGNDYASTDCNGGIITGFSLCGGEGKEYFKKVLFNPNWETSSSGTGTAVATYRGLKNLKISFKEIYSEIHKISNSNQLEYALNVLFSMLEKRIDDNNGNHPENFRTLYELFFKDHSYDYFNLLNLAEKMGLFSEAKVLEKILKHKLKEEILIDNILK